MQLKETIDGSVKTMFYMRMKCSTNNCNYSIFDEVNWKHFQQWGLRLNNPVLQIDGQWYHFDVCANLVHYVLEGIPLEKAVARSFSMYSICTEPSAAWRLPPNRVPPKPSWPR